MEAALLGPAERKAEALSTIAFVLSDLELRRRQKERSQSQAGGNRRVRISGKS